jgi:hypothetical protein
MNFLEVKGGRKREDYKIGGRKEMENLIEDE